MDMYGTSILGSAMLRADDGTYYGTIAATKHQCGDNAFVSRAVRKNEDGIWENVLFTYETATSGDITVRVDEPVSLRITIERGRPTGTSGTTGEEEEYADA